MRKENQQDHRMIKSGLMKVLIVMAFSFYCFAVSAQNAAVTATPVTTGKAPASDAANSNVAEFAKNHPNDGQAQAAYKYSLILENPSAFPEFNQQDLARIKSEQEGLLLRINFIDQQMKSGTDYEKAAALYQRELDRKAALDKATNPNKTVQSPASDPAPVMMNGNN